LECPPSKGDDIMAYGPSAVAPRQLSYTETSTKRVNPRGLLLRLFDAMKASRQRQVDREIADPQDGFLRDGFAAPAERLETGEQFEE